MTAPRPTADQLGGRTSLRLGTRRSALATTQSRWVAEHLAEALQRVHCPAPVDLVTITTHGDVDGKPLSSMGGTGVFVSALRDALLSGEVDLAVHSLKDLPTAPAPGLVVAAVPVREDPRDVLVARDGMVLGELPAGSKVGTGSPRRAAQLRALGLGLEVVDIRGNVDTRLKLVADGVVDAVVLAAAGLRRLDLIGEATELFDPLTMLPAPAQGALAVECRADDEIVVAALKLLDDSATRASVVAERALLRRLEAGCSAPVGALAEVMEGEDGDELSLRAVVASPDGAVTLRRSATLPLAERLHGPVLGMPPDPGTAAGPISHQPGTAVTVRTLEPSQEAAAEALGVALADEMLADGAADLMPVPALTAGAGATATSTTEERQ